MGCHQVRGAGGVPRAGCELIFAFLWQHWVAWLWNERETGFLAAIFEYWLS